MSVQPRLFGSGWIEVRDGDPSARALYERHYSCPPDRAAGRRASALIVGPGEKTVLLRADGRALFVWRRFIDDSGQTGVNCAAFRNEGEDLASGMILEAEGVARRRWPLERFYTYVDPLKVAPTTRAGRPSWGHCFYQAGWRFAGLTAKRLHVLEKRHDWAAPGAAVTSSEDGEKAA